MWKIVQLLLSMTKSVTASDPPGVDGSLCCALLEEADTQTRMHVLLSMSPLMLPLAVISHMWEGRHCSCPSVILGKPPAQPGSFLWFPYCLGICTPVKHFEKATRRLSQNGSPCLSRPQCILIITLTLRGNLLTFGIQRQNPVYNEAKDARMNRFSLFLSLWLSTTGCAWEEQILVAF